MRFFFIDVMLGIVWNKVYRKVVRFLGRSSRFNLDEKCVDGDKWKEWLSEEVLKWL